MKLRKALEKAKEAFEGSDALLNEFSDEEKRVSSREWTPPVYSESRGVSISEEKAIGNRCVGIHSDSPILESYKVLRTQILQRTQQRGFNTVMVTSPGQGEGKTLTAINLAFTFAKEFQQTTLLVDGDLREQKIHKYLGYESDKGIGEYLLSDKDLSDLIVWPGIDKLTIISGGKKIIDSTELLESPKMQTLVTEMKSRYQDRYIIFDMPALLKRADAVAFAPLIDCIVLVVEWGKTTTSDIKEALKLIPNEKLLGFVMNRARS